MLTLIRGCVRPAVILIMIITTAVYIGLRIEMPPEWYAMVGTVIAFWFGNRAARSKED